MSALVDDYFHLAPRPDPRIQEGARGGVGGAREPRLHMCQGDCLPNAFASSSSSHTPRSFWNGEVGDSHTTTVGNVNSDFVLSLFSFILFFLSSNGENEGEGEGEYHIGDMSLFSYPNPMRHFTHRTIPHYDYDFRWPNPHYGARAGTRPFFRDRLIRVSPFCSPPTPSVRVRAPPAAHTPLRIPSSRAPLTSFFLLLLRCFLMPFHFVFPHYGGFSLPLPSGSAPPRRVAFESPEPNPELGRTRAPRALLSTTFRSSIYRLFSFFSSFGFPLSNQPRPHKQKQPMIHVFLFAIHRQRPRYFSPVPSDFPQFPLHIPSAHHISYILFLLFFFSFSFASM